MRRLRNWAFILLMVLWISCSDRPRNVLSEDKMVDLLVDMELTEAYANTQYSSYMKEKNELGKKVLKKHGVSEETLDTTLAWYGRNMDQYAELFDKVDKKILQRKKKYMDIETDVIKEPDNLWPYPSHLVISPLSGSNVLNFVVSDPEIHKGDVLQFSMYLPNVEYMKGSLAVEYKGGEGEAYYQNFTSKHKIEITLHTDSAREVSKIYGTFSLRDSKVLPLYIDSISLKAEPLDSLNYRSKRRVLKSFGSLPHKPT